MKCSSCGSELNSGYSRCPYCRGETPYNETWIPMFLQWIIVFFYLLFWIGVLLVSVVVAGYCFYSLLTGS
jgi:hypothetical protein